MRTVQKHMSDLGIPVKEVNYRKLSKLFSDAVKKQDAEDLAKEARFENPEPKAKHLDWLKKAVEETIIREQEEVQGEFPVISSFDALQIAKAVSKKNSRDVGVKNLVYFLEKKWGQNKGSNLITAELLSMKDHFKRNYPKSAATSVIEDFAKKGYSTLPISDLVEIADKIRSQDDFDYYIKEAGLHTNNPFARKARMFILSIVNGESEEELQENE